MVALREARRAVWWHSWRSGRLNGGTHGGKEELMVALREARRARMVALRDARRTVWWHSGRP